MIYIQAVWDFLYQPIHAKLKNGHELSRMRGSASGGAVTIAGVLGEVLAGSMTSEEREWQERIERLRSEMELSTEKLTIADYGAQSPLKHISDEAMYRGRVVTRTVGEICRSSSKPLKWSLLLFRLIRTLKPARCLELGTCLGISGAYIAAAMKLNGTGSLVTIEGAEALAERARNNFRKLGFSDIDGVTGRFQDTLGGVVERAGSFDAIFIDGHHDGAATLRYFNTIVPALGPGAVVVFDDIGWSMEMHEAWKMLQAHEHICCSIDLFDMGICCIGSSPKERYMIAV
jgi:predicted O-methyltransferase YrrM